jgi:hypothetical protein
MAHNSFLPYFSGTFDQNGAFDPYCVIEMDEPPQKNQTGPRHGASVMWDEHFLL